VFLDKDRTMDNVQKHNINNSNQTTYHNTEFGVCLANITTQINFLTSHSCRSLFKKIKLYLCLIKRHIMKTYEGLRLQLHGFLPSAHNGDEYSVLIPGRFTQQENNLWYPVDGDSSVGKTTGYGLDDRRVGVRVPV
jgi:hypothetical protein